MGLCLISEMEVVLRPAEACVFCAPTFKDFKHLFLVSKYAEQCILTHVMRKKKKRTLAIISDLKIKSSTKQSRFT